MFDNRKGFFQFITTMETILYEDIKEIGGRYRWVIYRNIHVIEDKSTNFINATKMCAMYGSTKNGLQKHFTDWKYTNRLFIKNVESKNTEIMYSLINGRDTIKGTFIHRDIAVHFAFWCSLQLGFDIFKLINASIEHENTLLMERNRIFTKKNDALMEKIHSIEDRIVVPAQNMRVNELMVLMYSSHEDYYVVLRTQECGLKQAIKRCKIRHGAMFEVVFTILSYQNSRNLLHRFKEYTQEHKEQVTFRGTTFETTLGLDEIKTIFIHLEKTVL